MKPAGGFSPEACGELSAAAEHRQEAAVEHGRRVRLDRRVQRAGHFFGRAEGVVRRGRPPGRPGPGVHDPAVVSLRVRIAELGISQTRLAALADLPATTLSRLVMGRRPLDRNIELRLHRILDIEERAQAAAEAVRRREYARAAIGGVLGDESRPKTGAAS